MYLTESHLEQLLIFSDIVSHTFKPCNTNFSIVHFRRIYQIIAELSLAVQKPAHAHGVHVGLKVGRRRVTFLHEATFAQRAIGSYN